MFEKFLFRSLAVVAAAALLTTSAYGDVFNMGSELTSLEMVPVSNAGNANDAETGYGSVADPYNIGKYEVTNAQWREFLTAKASVTDSHGLYSTSMATTYGGIDRTWSVDHYVYTARDDNANWDDRAVSHVSFWDAARFCNWLHNGQGSGDTETGAYINLDNQGTFARQSGAKYFIPTENEWYKAAYYDPNKGGMDIPGYWDYPMMSDNPTVPSNDLTTLDSGNNANFYQNGFTIGPQYYTTLVGEFELSESAYGTFDQGGNLWEWNETTIRGGGRDSDSDFMLASSRYSPAAPSYEVGDVGFRVASVPEPSTFALLTMGAVGLLVCAWRRKRI